MDKLRFGTAGIPISTPKSNTVNGVKYVRELGLECMELEFVHSVNITEEKAPVVRKMALEKDVVLSCHGQYYINLNSEERKKIEESKQRIFKAGRIAWLCGAKSVTFHAGFYMKNNEGETYRIIKNNIKEIVERLRLEDNKIWVRPETTGKISQWGSLKEVLRLSSELEGVMPCVDFSHLHARSIGKLNDYEAFRKVLEEVERSLGKEGLGDMHIHVSGIEYGARGEKWHLELGQSEFRWKGVLKALKEFRCKGVVISESPNIEKDALMMQREYGKV